MLFLYYYRLTTGTCLTTKEAAMGDGGAEGRGRGGDKGQGIGAGARHLGLGTHQMIGELAAILIYNTVNSYPIQC